VAVQRPCVPIDAVEAVVAEARAASGTWKDIGSWNANVPWKWMGVMRRLGR
jgi:hypothetical protein